MPTLRKKTSSSLPGQKRSGVQGSGKIPFKKTKRKRTEGGGGDIMHKAVVAKMEASNIATALQFLKTRDPKLGRMIDVLGPPHSLLRRIGYDAFTSLVKSICAQQLSSAAAQTIFNRLHRSCCPSGNGSSSGAEVVSGAHAVRLSPCDILSKPDEDLRQLGLSGRKCEYVKELSRRFSMGELSDAALHSMADEDVVAELTRTRGLGVWSAHMFLMFHLGRPDVLPVGDLGVRKGAHAIYNRSQGKGKGKIKASPSSGSTGKASVEDLEKIGELWRPYRSIGSWYMWQAQEYLTLELQNSGQQ